MTGTKPGGASIPANSAPKPSKKKSTKLPAILLGVVIVAAVGAITWAFIGGNPPWDPPPQIKVSENPVPATPESLAAAKEIYDLRCAHCHGSEGQGDGPDTDKLSIEPTDFTDGPEMKRLTDGEIFWRIGVGRRPMPAFKDRLTDTQRWELVNYIRSFAQPLPKSP